MKALAEMTVEQEMELVRKAQAGDAAAFESLMRQYSGMVYAKAIDAKFQEADARDIVQVVFMKAYKDMNRFKLESRFSTWLVSIARNTMLEHWRHKKAFPEESREYFKIDAESDGSDPADYAQAAEASADIDERVEELPDELRETYKLRKYQKLSYDEIAAKLGIPRQTVGSRISRARSRLEGR